MSMSDSLENPETDPTVTELLSRAKQAIESVDASYRAAGDAMAAAQQQGTTQQEIADAVGKSVPWVSVLLKWHARGNWDETPFGPQSKASRKRRAELLQATKVEEQQSTCPGEQEETPDDTPTVEAADDGTKVEAPAVTVTSPSILEPPSSDGNWLPAFDLTRPGVAFVVGGANSAVLEVAVKIGATVSAGGEWPDYRRAERGDVIWLSSRTGVAQGLRAKFEAAGAHIQGIRFMDAIADDLGLPIRNLSDDVRRLGQRLKSDGSVKCVVFDYFAEYMSFGTAERPFPDLQRALDALQDFAVKHSITIVLPCQLPTRDADTVVGAVQAIKAIEAVNTVFSVQRDGKQNRGVVQSITKQPEYETESYTFQLRNRDSVPVVVWDKPSADTTMLDKMPNAVLGVADAPDLSPNALSETENAAEDVPGPTTGAGVPQNDHTPSPIADGELNSITAFTQRI